MFQASLFDLPSADEKNDAERILFLRKELHRHNNNYYVRNAPEISDRQFDDMMHELEELEERHPEMRDPNSPTQRVGSDLSNDFEQAVFTRDKLEKQLNYLPEKEIEAPAPAAAPANDVKTEIK